jgi:hypothetical protein
LKNPLSALEIAQARVDRAAENRANMPQCAAAKDLFTALFGPAVKMTYAEENGRTIGRKDTQKWVRFGLTPRSDEKPNAYRERR